MEQTDLSISNLESKVPIIVKDITLISPGEWRGKDKILTYYSEESIRNGFENTSWDNMMLFLDHQDTEDHGVSNLAGFVRNARLSAGGIVGDLEIWHPIISTFINQAKATFGVSMTTEGIERMNGMDSSEYDIKNYKSFSLVIEPACKSAMIPKQLSKVKTLVSGSINLNVDKTTINNYTQKLEIEDKITQPEEILGDDTNSMKNNSEDIKNNMEVNEMTDEIQKTEEVKEEQPVQTIDNGNDAFKELNAKFDELSTSVEKALSGIASLTEIVQKNLSAEVPEAPKMDEVPEVVPEVPAEVPEEEEDEDETAKELSAVKKELSAMKESLEKINTKKLSNGSEDKRMEISNANLGMISFLRKNANLDY